MTNENRYPEITVVVPTYNRMDVLPQTLAALQAQEWDQKLFEVLVIDDGSTDDTADWLRTFTEHTTLQFRFHRQGKNGPAAARNWGIDNARGRWLLFLDADIWVQKDLVQQHWHHHQTRTSDAQCWLGRIAPSRQLERWQQYRWDEFAVRREEQTRELPWFRYRTPNSSFSVDDLRKIGGFDNDFLVSEDIELAFRLAGKGMRFFYDAGMEAVHHHPMTLPQYLEKARCYGRSAVVWQKKHASEHIELARLFGLYDRNLSAWEKMRHGVKSAAVNRFSTPVLLGIGVALQQRKHKWAPVILTLVYRYHVRKAFHRA